MSISLLSHLISIFLCSEWSKMVSFYRFNLHFSFLIIFICFYVFFLFCFWLYPRDCYVDQDDLELTEILLLSASPSVGNIGIKAVPHHAWLFHRFFFSLFLEHLSPFNWTSFLDASPHQINNWHLLLYRMSRWYSACYIQKSFSLMWFHFLMKCASIVLSRKSLAMSLS